MSKAVKRVRRLDTTKEGMPRTNLFCEEDEEDGNTEEAVHHTQGNIIQYHVIVDISYKWLTCTSVLLQNIEAGDPDALYEDDDMGYDGGECDLKKTNVD